MMLMTIAAVSTDVLLTFIRGPKGLKRVTWRKLLESSLAKKSSYSEPLSRSVLYSPEEGEAHWTGEGKLFFT